MKAIHYVVIIFCIAAAGSLIISCGAAEALGDFSMGKASSKTAEKSMPEESLAEPVRDLADENEIAPGMPQDDEGTASAVSEIKEPERKRVYTGFAELLVDNLEATKLKISDIADASGGYVEEILDNTITIRVPAAKFSILFEGIQDLGDVLDAYEETVDVTDFYADMESRLKIAKNTRDRLYDLLERTEDVEERIKILKEIRRLSEEIERINLTFEVLKDHIAFSRITVRLVSRLDYQSGREDEIPFPWVDNLHPLYPAARRFKGSVKGDLPDMFAVFKKDKYYHAETADGIRFRLSTVRNKPRGDADFWQAALLYHLAPRFAGVEEEEIGEVLGVLLKSKDITPYYYMVGVIPDGRNLHVLELFVPDEELFEKQYSDVLLAIEEIRIR